jgi:hypothetical protein
MLIPLLFYNKLYPKKQNAGYEVEQVLRVCLLTWL